MSPSGRRRVGLHAGVLPMIKRIVVLPLAASLLHEEPLVSLPLAAPHPASTAPRDYKGLGTTSAAIGRTATAADVLRGSAADVVPEDVTADVPRGPADVPRGPADVPRGPADVPRSADIPRPADVLRGPADHVASRAAGDVLPFSEFFSPFAERTAKVWSSNGGRGRPANSVALERRRPANSVVLESASKSTAANGDSPLVVVDLDAEGNAMEQPAVVPAAGAQEGLVEQRAQRLMRSERTNRLPEERPLQKTTAAVEPVNGPIRQGVVDSVPDLDYAERGAAPSSWGQKAAEGDGGGAGGGERGPPPLRGRNWPTVAAPLAAGVLPTAFFSQMPDSRANFSQTLGLW